MYNMVDNRSDKTMDNMEGKRPKETKNFSSKIEKSALHRQGKVLYSIQRRKQARPTDRKEVQNNDNAGYDESVQCQIRRAYLRTGIRI